MRRLLSCAALIVVLGALQSVRAEEAVEQGGQASSEELAQLKQIVGKLTLRIENLERRLETKAVAERAPDDVRVTRSYRVVDLVPLVPGGYLELDHLERYITTHIAPKQWESAGGQGTIRPYVQNLSLVIMQTEEVHAEISQWLSQLRAAKALLHDYDKTKPAPEPPVDSTSSKFTGTHNPITLLNEPRNQPE